MAADRELPLLDVDDVAIDVVDVPRVAGRPFGPRFGTLVHTTLATVTLDADGRIESATAAPVPTDGGCDAMCAAQGNGRRFLAEFGACDDVVGMTLREAAFRDWQDEPSGCFCTAGNRRHKWRNVFQTLHYALTRSDRPWQDA